MAKVELTKAELQDYVANREKKLAADRLSRALDDKLNPVKEKISEYIDQHGGADRTTTKHGFVLHKELQPGVPKYKDEFLKIATEKEVKAIERPIQEKISVSPVGAAAAQ